MPFEIRVPVLLAELACGQEEKPKKKRRQEKKPSKEGKRRRKAEAQRGACRGQDREMNKEQSSREGTSENPTSIENRTTVWGNREKTLVPGRLEPPTFDLSHTCLLTEPQLSETHLLPPLHLHPHSLSSSCIWFLTINRKQAFHISRRFYSMSLVNSASQPPRQPFHPKSSVLILSQWPCF